MIKLFTLPLLLVASFASGAQESETVIAAKLDAKVQAEIKALEADAYKSTGVAEIVIDSHKRLHSQEKCSLVVFSLRFRYPDSLGNRGINPLIEDTRSVIAHVKYHSLGQAPVVTILTPPAH